ncbi:MAG: hypothetical protein H6739_37345 [Alphaproteobacteria bacterium]|nr:hypothetical protein [Alphaproteobacteria bacterium]
MSIERTSAAPSTALRRLAGGVALALALWVGVAHAASEDIAAEVVAEIRTTDGDLRDPVRPWLARLDAEDPAARAEAEAVVWGVLDGLVAWEDEAFTTPVDARYTVNTYTITLAARLRRYLFGASSEYRQLSPDAQAALARWAMTREPLPPLRLLALQALERRPQQPEAVLVPALSRPDEPALVVLAIERAVAWEARSVAPALQTLLDHPADAVRKGARAALMGWGLEATARAPALPPELAQALLDTARLTPPSIRRVLRRQRVHAGVLRRRPPFGDLERWIDAGRALQRGREGAAMRLLGPSLGDDVLWTQAAFHVAERAMREGFTELTARYAERHDYAAAMDTLAWLTDPFFARTPGYDVAVDLAAQLPERGEDFVTLTLPTVEGWAAQQQTLSREAQIRALGAWMRLVHDRPCWGTGWRRGHPPDDPPVIDPYTALWRMDLSGVDDARALVDALADDAFTLTPTESPFFDLEPRSFWRVNELMADLFADAVLHLDVVVPLVRARTDAERAAARAALLDWLDAHQGWSRERLAVASVLSGETWADVAAGELRGMRGLVVPLAENPRIQPDHGLLALLYGLDDPAAVPYARGQEKNVWAALILARHVPEEREAWLAHAAGLMDIGYKLQLTPRALFLERVDASEPDALTEARAMLSTEEPDLAAVHRLLWRGEAEAFAAVDAALAEGRWEPRWGPSLRGSLAGWSGLTDPSVGALRAWLAARAAEARAGRPVGMARPLPIWPAGCDARVPQSCD